jgi:multicomponent Na+:H+ antiporter subunit G
MNEVVAAVFMLIGTFFSLMAAIGTLRFPDLYMRMGAATKAGTLGAGFQLIAVAAYFWEIEIVTEVLAAIGFFILTAPVGAHMIGRAAYVIGVKKWPGMIRDDLKGKYDQADKRVLGEN